MEKKHRIFKYSKFWYFDCAWCQALDVLPGRSFGHVIYLSTDHVESKHREYLTLPLSL